MKIGQLRVEKPIENAMREIREWLERIDVTGLDINLNYDARSNIALLKLKYKNKNYEFRSQSQKNCRLNMHAIARVIEFKVRAHLMEIEQFDKSMVAYLAIEDSSGYTAPNGQNIADERFYVTLGISPLASNEEIEKRYKQLCKMYHPDMSLSKEGKEEFTRKFGEINEAYAEIKRARGI